MLSPDRCQFLSEADWTAERLRWKSGLDSAAGRLRCAVWGSPVEHSLSPLLHRAAYDALGLTTWTYERSEVDAASFASAFAQLDETWRGLSLTMPLKEAALSAAHDVTELARQTGVANTLVRRAGRWMAANTDVEGVAGALLDVGCVDTRHAIVVGSGATARSAVAALASAGTTRITFMVRGDPRPETVALAHEFDIATDVVGMGQWSLCDVVISTVPPSSVTQVESFPATDRQESPRTVLDVVYGSGQTALQQAAGRTGWAVAPGTRMLLHQAAAQVVLMTGEPAPLAAMSDALDRVTDDRWRMPGTLR